MFTDVISFRIQNIKQIANVIYNINHIIQNVRYFIVSLCVLVKTSDPRRQWSADRRTCSTAVHRQPLVGMFSGSPAVKRPDTLCVTPYSGFSFPLCNSIVRCRFSRQNAATGARFKTTTSRRRTLIIHLIEICTAFQRRCAGEMMIGPISPLAREPPWLIFTQTRSEVK